MDGILSMSKTQMAAQFEADGLSPSTARQYAGHVARWRESGLSAAEFTQTAPTRKMESAWRTALKRWAQITGVDLVLPPPTQAPKAPRDTLAPAQVRGLLLALYQTETAREYAAATIMYACGLRTHELVSLGLDDVDLERRQLVAGERRLPFNLVAQRALRVYLTEMRPQLAAEKSPPTVFLSRRGAAYRPELLRDALRRAASRTGIRAPKKALAGLRDACLSHLRRRGMNIRYLQEFAGHASIAQTALYLRLSREEVRGDLERALRHEKRAQLEVLRGA